MRTYKVTRGAHYHADTTMAVPELYYKQLFLPKISTVIAKFPAVSTFVQKELVHSLADHI